jgi:hypothetical protein
MHYHPSLGEIFLHSSTDGSECFTQHLSRKMANLFDDMAEVKVYIDNVLLVTKGSFYDHFSQLEEVFHQLLKAQMQLNVMKCSFCALEMEYLGFVLTPKGIKPQTKHVPSYFTDFFSKNCQTSLKLYWHD